MERIPSHSSFGSLEESEPFIGVHDNVEPTIQDSALAVATGSMETGGGVEHVEAHFNSQQGQQSSSSVRGEARSAIGRSLGAFVGASAASHAEVAPAANDDLLGTLQEAETSIATSREIVSTIREQGHPADIARTIQNFAGDIAKNNESLIRLLDSSGLSGDTVNQLRGQLQHDRDYLNNNIVSENQLPQSNPGMESKEENFDNAGIERAVDRMGEALDHAHNAYLFLRDNIPAPIYHAQEEVPIEVPIQQQHVVEHGEGSSDHSAETLLGTALQRDSLSSLGETIDQLAPPPPPPQGNEVLENSPQFQNFIGRIFGGTDTQISAYRFHRDAAQAAEGRRDWNEARVHWMSAVNRAANELQTIQNHQLENNTVHQHPELTEELTQRHAQWTNSQNHALARARQANDNARCCTIA